MDIATRTIGELHEMQGRHFKTMFQKLIANRIDEYNWDDYPCYDWKLGRGLEPKYNTATFRQLIEVCEGKEITDKPSGVQLGRKNNIQDGNHRLVIYKYLYGDSKEIMVHRESLDFKYFVNHLFTLLFAPVFMVFGLKVIKRKLMRRFKK